jgi:hypothetical protein
MHMPDLSPSALQPILVHLLTWGELSSAEARRLKAEVGSALLASGGMVQVVPDAWLMGPALRRVLPGTSLEEIWQKACWSLPAYQVYLSSLAAGEIARRGLEGAGALVETWVARQLPGRAADFNAFLDAVESDLSLPLSESSPGALVKAVTQRLQKIEREAGLDFAAWDSALLGISAPNEAVFQAALARGALAGSLDGAIETPAAPAPIQDLNAELAQPSSRPVICPRLEHPNPWGHPNLAENPAWRIRCYGYSSVPLLAEGEGGIELTPAQVQAAFCQHPLSWIVVQLGLHAQIQANSGAGETLRLALERNAEGMLCDLRIAVPGGAVRHLGEALPALLSGMGFHLFLPFGVLSPIALGSWLEALLQADILVNRSDGVFLGEDFGRAAFESQHYQALVKTPKPWRVRLVEILNGG